MYSILVTGECGFELQSYKRLKFSTLYFIVHQIKYLNEGVEY